MGDPGFHCTSHLTQRALFSPCILFIITYEPTREKGHKKEHNAPTVSTTAHKPSTELFSALKDRRWYSIFFFQASFAVLARPPTSTAKVARLGFIAHQHITLIGILPNLACGRLLVGHFTTFTPGDKSIQRAFPFFFSFPSHTAVCSC